MSTNLSIFNEGIVQQIGRPIDVYNDPKNLFVANFMGTINAIEGHVQDGKFKSKLGMIINNIRANNGSHSILLRPQNLYLQKNSSSHQEFNAKVVSIEFLGNLIRYFINILDQELIIEDFHEINKKIYAKGDNIKVYLDSEKIKIL